MDVRRKKPAKIICVASRKGGVGKTTTTMNLGVALARKFKKRVLLVDSDPQGNLSSYLGVVPGTAPFESLKSMVNIYQGESPKNSSERKLYIANTQSGVDLVAVGEGLDEVDQQVYSKENFELILSQFLMNYVFSYDLILIDTPPSSSLLTTNALCSSDYVLIPVHAEYFSLEGVFKIHLTIQKIKEDLNRQIRIIGVLPTQISKRRKLTKKLLQTLKTKIGHLLFDTIIHDNAAVTESSGHAKSVLDFQGSSKGAKDYIQAAKELLFRLEQWDKKLNLITKNKLEEVRELELQRPPNSAAKEPEEIHN